MTTMKKWDVLTNNGFNFEYYCTVESPSAKQARKDFLKKHAGAWYANPSDIKVRQVREIKQGE